VTIIDPGVKADPTARLPGWLAKDYFVRREDGSLYAGVVWPGEGLPDFSRADTAAGGGAASRVAGDGAAAIWDDERASAHRPFIPGAAFRMVHDAG
jgi:alpha-glucosidase